MRKHLLCASIFALFAATFGTACTEDDTTDDESADGVTTTSLIISPSAFLGDVPCAAKDGALRSYVVTLIDETDPDHLVVLPSSSPVPCSGDVSFRFITPTHNYRAEVDGYDIPAPDLVPSGSPGSGSRHMLPKGGGAEVAPRWTTTCTPITAAEKTFVRFETCEPLVDHKGPSPTSIKVDPSAALGNLGCVADGGQVVSFDITPVDAPLPPVTGLACGAAPITYNSGIEPGRTYRFQVGARAAAGDPILWGASCFATAEEGLTSPTTCDPLSSTGAVVVEGSSLLKKAGVACGDKALTYEAVISLPAASLESGRVDCAEDIRFIAVPPGLHGVNVRAFGPDNAQVLNAFCEAEVTPGASAITHCAAFP